MATFAKPKNSKPNKKKLPLDRPFAKDILARATAIVKRYQIVLWFEDGDWYGHGLELPGAYGDGKTPTAAVADTREGMIAVVGYMLEQGERPPTPASEGQRTEQINIRVTCEEKSLLETRARAGGFKGIADFVRTAALAEK
jgi:predicted RNase H-like HicB family nuclease